LRFERRPIHYGSADFAVHVGAERDAELDGQDCREFVRSSRVRSRKPSIAPYF